MVEDRERDRDREGEGAVQTNGAASSSAVSGSSSRPMALEFGFGQPTQNRPLPAAAIRKRPRPRPHQSSALHARLGREQELKIETQVDGFLESLANALGTCRKSTLAEKLLAALIRYPWAEGCECDEHYRMVRGALSPDEIHVQSQQFHVPVVTVALEYRHVGTRLFVCTTRQHFPHYFMCVRSNGSLDCLQSWHELLQPTCPVNLYMDVDLDTRQSVHGERLLVQLCSDLRQYIHARGAASEQLQMVQLDASTMSKFSRHVIVHGCHFRNAAAAGLFMAEFLGPKEDERKPAMVDRGAYKAKQNLRMLESPKFASDNHLKLRSCECCELPAHGFRFHSGCCACAEILIASLATGDSVRLAAGGHLFSMYQLEKEIQII